MKQLIALIIAALLLIGAACAEDAMQKPPSLSLLNMDGTLSYITMSGSYSWEYPTGNADEWSDVEACGMGPTDPYVFENTQHLLLEDTAAFILDFQDYYPESVHAFAWDNAVFNDSQNPDAWQIALDDVINPLDDRLTITLEPGRVYLIQAKWPHKGKKESGNADYFIVTDGVMNTLAENTDDIDDAEWNLPETIEMTEEISTIFNRAMEGLVGVNYEPLGYLGEKDGVYCILCRATVVYPGAKPYYALVYVNDTGVQNIWDIWMDAHSKK